MKRTPQRRVVSVDPYTTSLDPPRPFFALLVDTMLIETSLLRGTFFFATSLQRSGHRKMILCYLEPDQGKPWAVENRQRLTRIVEIAGFNPSESI